MHRQFERRGSDQPGDLGIDGFPVTGLALDPHEEDDPIGRATR
jgi:hypothetical protein